MSLKGVEITKELVFNSHSKCIAMLLNKLIVQLFSFRWIISLVKPLATQLLNFENVERGLFKFFEYQWLNRFWIIKR